MFDESYSNIVKNGRIDMHIRYWNTSLNAVKTRFYNSQFMGKAVANDVLKIFKDCVNGMDEDKLLQVSVDGPNLNTSFLTCFSEERMDRELIHLALFGSCGLHTIQKSFKHGESATGWNLKKLLSSMFKIFHESPSRRADYEMFAEAQNLDYHPFQFCGHRWV